MDRMTLQWWHQFEEIAKKVNSNIWIKAIRAG